MLCTWFGLMDTDSEKHIMVCYRLKMATRPGLLVFAMTMGLVYFSSGNIREGRYHSGFTFNRSIHIIFNRNVCTVKVYKFILILILHHLLYSIIHFQIKLYVGQVIDTVWANPKIRWLGALFLTFAHQNFYNSASISSTPLMFPGNIAL